MPILYARSLSLSLTSSCTEWNEPNKMKENLLTLESVGFPVYMHVYWLFRTQRIWTANHRKRLDGNWKNHFDILVLLSISFINTITKSKKWLSSSSIEFFFFFFVSVIAFIYVIFIELSATSTYRSTHFQSITQRLKIVMLQSVHRYFWWKSIFGLFFLLFFPISFLIAFRKLSLYTILLFIKAILFTFIDKNG